MSYQLIVVAKAPVPGRVKTRLCPPCTPQQAAELAHAALLDTLAAVAASSAARRMLLLDGDFLPPPGWEITTQRGDGLAQRLANGLADTRFAGMPSVLIGMDTPQVTPELLERLVTQLSTSDGVLAPAADGGWWALGLPDPHDAAALRDVPMSQPDTCRLTREAFTAQGLSISSGPMLRDVDTIADALAVAAQCGHTRFARTVAEQTSSWRVRS